MMSFYFLAWSTLRSRASFWCLAMATSYFASASSYLIAFCFFHYFLWACEWLAFPASDFCLSDTLALSARTCSSVLLARCLCFLNRAYSRFFSCIY